MKSKVNGNVSNLTQEVQKLNTKFKPLMSYLGLGLGNSLSERLIALERKCFQKIVLMDCPNFLIDVRLLYFA